MKFYYVNEANKLKLITAITNLGIYHQIIKLVEAEKRYSGFVAVIGKQGKLRASITFRTTTNYKMKLIAFIRKHRALNALEILEK